MNTNIQVILENLAQGTLKYHKGIHMRVIDSLGFSIKRRRRRTPNKENSRERMDKTNSRESNSFVLYWDIRKGMSIYCLREEKKYTSYSHR